MNDADEVARLDIHEVARLLVSELGATVVAVLAGVRDRKLPYRWMKADGPSPRMDAESRLRVSLRVWRIVSASDGPNIARAWFIGCNPRLEEEQPIVALREGRAREVVAAAHAFANGVDQ